MKKRILSLLLLVAMVVTALPLVVLPTTAATAATEPEWTEEDYDALYTAQEAALISLDFFKTNSYWGETLTLPEKPEEMTAYAYNGKTYDFTKVENRLIGEDCNYIVRRKEISTGKYLHHYYQSNGTSNFQTDIYAAYPQEEAEALVASLTASNTNANLLYEAVPYANWYIVSQKGNTNSWLQSNGTVANSAAAKLFADKAEATAKAQELAGGVAAGEDGSFTAADGAVYSVVWRPQINYIYNTAIATYKSELLKVLYAQNYGGKTPTVTFAVNVPATGERTHHKQDGSHSYGPFVVGDGYIELNPHDSNSYLNINNVPATGTIFVDMVVAGGAGTTSGSAPFAIRSAYLNFKVDANGMTFLGTKAYNSQTTTTNFTTQHTVADRLAPVRITIDSTVNADKNAMTFNTVVDGVTVFGAEGETISGTNFGTSLFAHANSTKFRFYTFRIYNRTLTEAEQAQNHFADLAKWFKLDLTALQLLSASEFAPIYAAVADFGFDSDKAEVQAAVVAAATKIAEEKFADANPDYLALAVKYGIDLSVLDIWPVGMLKNTYAFLNGGWEQSTNVRADYEAAVAADVGSTLSAADYNKLYAQNGLVWAADFATTNEYWGGSTISGTYTAAESNALLNGYRWAGSNSFLTTYASSATSGTVTIKDGALHLAPFYYLQVQNIKGVINTGIDGATMETVRNFTQSGVVSHFLGFRLEGNVYTNKGTAIGIGSTSKGYNAGRVYDIDVDFSSLTTVSTHTVSLVKPKANNANNNLQLAEDVYASFTDTEKGLVVNLDEVVYDSEGGTKAIWTRFYPYEQYKPDYVQKNGELVANTEGKTYCVAQNRFVVGSAAVYQNGNAIYENDAFNFIDTPFHDDDTYLVLWGSSGSAASAVGAADLYFLRFYHRILTEAEMAQNHFADVAKYYRLNIAGLDALDADDRAELYAAVKDITVGVSTQSEAQAAVSAILNAKADAAYDAMKEGVTNPAVLAFIETAKSYRLNVNAVLASKRDMSTVYALSFDGLSSTEAQALLDEAYLDAYYYLSYMKEGQTEWNDMLTWCANHEGMTGADRVDLEALMALPFAERVGVLALKDEYENAASVAEAQAIIDAFVEDAMATYTADLTDYDYNSIYQQEGLLLAVDFFKTNKYWNTTGETFSVPLGPSENPNYFYDANKNNVEDAGERYDLTDASVRNAWRVLITYNGKATGFYEEGKDDPWNGVTYAQVTTYYADQATAEKAAADAKTAIDAAIDAKNASVDKSKLTTSAVLAGSNAFYEAYYEWATKADRQYLATYAWKLSGSISVFSYTPAMDAGRTDFETNSAKCLGVYTHGAGYIQMRTDFHSSGGLQIGNVVSGGFKTDNMSFQTVTSYAGATSGTPILWHNARPTLSLLEHSSKFSKVVTGFTASGFPETAAIRTGYESVNDITYTMSGGLNNGDAGTFMIRTPGETLVSASGTYGTLDDTTYFDYNHQGKSMRIYAFREYNVELTDDAILMNHFADLAKYFRIDITGYDALSDAQYAKLYNAVADMTFENATREDVQAALFAVLSEAYAPMYASADIDADFLAIARELALDISPILAIRERAARDAIVADVTADFRAGHAMNAGVVRTMLKKEMAFLDALAFRGMQVRINSGYAPTDLPGVRALFAVDDALLAADAGITAFGVQILNAAGEVRATLTFNAKTLTGESVITGKEDQPTDATVKQNEDGTYEFAYTVIYGSEAVRTKTYYEAKMGYRFFVVYNGVTYTRDVTTSFGDTVSAAMVYTFFAENGAGHGVDPNDSVIQSVMRVLNATETPAEQE